MLTACRRIDKCPIPGQRLTDKFATAEGEWARLELTDPQRNEMHDEIIWYNYENDRAHFFFLLLLKFKDSHFDDTITSTTVLIHFFLLLLKFKDSHFDPEEN